MEEAVDTSVYFTDGHVVAKNKILIAAKLNADSEVDFSRVLYCYDDEWTHDDVDDSVHSIWFIDNPRTCFWLGRKGLMFVVGGGKKRAERIGDATNYGHLNRIRGIGGNLYICGYGGQVYQRQRQGWVHMDDGVLVPEPDERSVDLQDIDGTSADDIYTVGTGGALFHYDGKRWIQLDSPTNVHLLRVRSVGKTEVYLCGSNGVLFKGYRDHWVSCGDPDFKEHFWGLEYYREQIYLAHHEGLMVWNGKRLKPVDMGLKKQVTCHRLHANDGVLWSFGMDDLVFFDGKKWHEVICAENVP